MRLATRQAKSSDGLAKKVKNVSHDSLQGKMGRIHMKRQDLDKLVSRSRFKKALRRPGSDDAGAAAGKAKSKTQRAAVTPKPTPRACASNKV